MTTTDNASNFVKAFSVAKRMTKVITTKRTDGPDSVVVVGGRSDDGKPDSSLPAEPEYDPIAEAEAELGEEAPTAEGKFILDPLDARALFAGASAAEAVLESKEDYYYNHEPEPPNPQTIETNDDSDYEPVTTEEEEDSESEDNEEGRKQQPTSSRVITTPTSSNKSTSTSGSAPKMSTSTSGSAPKMSTSTSGSASKKSTSTSGSAPKKSTSKSSSSSKRQAPREEDMESPHLPPHQRCAAHTFSLVGTTDAIKGEGKLLPAVKTKMRKAFAKCCKFWVSYRRTSHAADLTKTILHAAPYIPVKTRWNSQYLGIKWLLQRDKDDLRKVFNSVEVNSSALTDACWQVMKDYVAVMSPIAGAITYLESQKNMYLGHLIPTVKAVIIKLRRLTDEIESFAPMTKYLRERVEERFKGVLTNSYCQLATAFHPDRRMVGTRSTDRAGSEDFAAKADLRASMVSALEELCDLEPDTQEGEGREGDSGGENLSGTEGDGLFDVFASGPSSQNTPVVFDAVDTVKRFLAAKRPAKMFLDCKVLARAFIKYNTPLPSSAPVERMFSVGGDILRPKRSSMADDNFERAMFLRINGALLWLQEFCQRRR